MACFLYLIEEVPHSANESGPWTKIGFGNKPQVRCRSLAQGNPRDLRVVAQYEFDSDVEAYEAEKKAKNHFHHFRRQGDGFRVDQGEWFKIPWKDVDKLAVASGWRKRVTLA